MRDLTFLTAGLSFYVIFCCFLRLLSPPSQLTYVLNGPIQNITTGGIPCDDIMSEHL